MRAWLLAGLIIGFLASSASAEECRIPWDPKPFKDKNYIVIELTEKDKAESISKFMAQFPEIHPNHVYVIGSDHGVIMIIMVKGACVVGVGRPGRDA